MKFSQVTFVLLCGRLNKHFKVIPNQFFLSHVRVSTDFNIAARIKKNEA